MNKPLDITINADDESAVMIFNHPQTGDMMVTVNLTHDQKLWVIARLLGEGKLVFVFDGQIAEMPYAGGDINELTGNTSSIEG